MKTALWVLVLILFFFALQAVAKSDVKMVARSGDDVITLTTKPCTDSKVMSSMLAAMQVSPEVSKAARHGTYLFQGKVLEICWLASNGRVSIVDEDGDTGTVPMGAFREETSM